MNENFAISIGKDGEINKIVLCGNVNEIVAYTIMTVKIIYEKIDKTNKTLAEFFKETMIHSISEGLPFMTDEELDKTVKAVSKKKKKLFSGKDE